MRLTVLLAAIVTTINQASPALAQDAQGLLRASFREAVRPHDGGFPLTVSEQQLTALDNTAGPHRADGVAIRSAQTTPVPFLHRSVSIRRLALGALIGGATGAALGYAMSTRSCGATSSRQECVGYGRLGAAVGGGVGAVLGVRIAAERP